MNIPVSLCITMSAYLFGAIFKKYYSREFSQKSSRHIYNAITSFIVVITLLLWGGIGKPSLFTILLGVLFGVITAIYQIVNLKALEMGPVSYTTVIISLSTILPALSGAIFWHEKLGVSQIVGMVLLVACLFLSINFKDKDKKGSISWLIYCMAAFLSVGGIGIMQKAHQTSDFKAEVNAFLIVAFLCSFVYSGITLCIYKMKQRKGEKEQKEKLIWKKLLLWGALLVVAGIAIAFNNKLNLILAGIMDSAVFFPLVNGGGLVLTTVGGVIFFKEKLTVLQWIGVVVGIASVVLLCNPFA